MDQFKGMGFGFGIANSFDDMLTQMEKMIGRVNLQEMALNRDELINYHGSVSLRDDSDPVFQQWEIYGDDEERLSSWGIVYVNDVPDTLYVETLRGEQYCEALLQEKLAEWCDRGEVEGAHISYDDELLDLLMNDEVNPLDNYTVMVCA